MEEEQKKEEEQNIVIDPRIAELEKERAEYLAGWQRAKADFLNYKKEETERMQGLLFVIHESFLLKLLPVADNLSRAEAGIVLENQNADIQGFLQIAKQLKEFLKNQGIEEIQAQGEMFNPSVHEAVEEVEGQESGRIVKVYEKGYSFKGKLLRPAKVSIVK